MGRERKIYFLLAAVISLIIPVTSMLVYYSNLTKADLPPPALCFETPDQDDSRDGDRDESRISELTASSDTLLLGGNLLEKVPRPFSQTPSFDQRAIILRC